MNGESTSMVWSTLGSRTAKERTITPALIGERSIAMSVSVCLRAGWFVCSLHGNYPT